MTNHAHLSKPLQAIVREAGRIVMSHYNGEITVDIKDDASPVTQADKGANDYIVDQLQKLTPDIPIIAEESTNDSAIADAPKFWLVDPVDGTKSFIKRTGEFTVNIGLIEHNKPVIGMVLVPAKDTLYYTGDDGKAYKQVGEDHAFPITVRIPPTEGLSAVASVSHRTAETDDFLDKLNVKQFVAAASSLKFCLVAEGSADIYPRFGPTMEWDTAAADAVLRAAGGTVENPDGSIFAYGKNDFRNGFFIAWGKK